MPRKTAHCLADAQACATEKTCTQQGRHFIASKHNKEMHTRLYRQVVEKRTKKQPRAFVSSKRFASTSRICSRIHIPYMFSYQHNTYVFVSTQNKCISIHTKRMYSCPHAICVFVSTQNICLRVHMPHMYSYPRSTIVYIFTYHMRLCQRAYTPPHTKRPFMSTCHTCCDHGVRILWWSAHNISVLPHSMRVFVSTDVIACT